jgi:hypothetical protein
VKTVKHVYALYQPEPNYWFVLVSQIENMFNFKKSSRLISPRKIAENEATPNAADPKQARNANDSLHFIY